jgi:hypothetical protein
LYLSRVGGYQPSFQTVTGALMRSVGTRFSIEM